MTPKKYFALQFGAQFYAVSFRKYINFWFAVYHASKSKQTDYHYLYFFHSNNIQNYRNHS